MKTNEMLNLSDDDYILISKKLEFRFKKSNNPLTQKIIDKETLSDDDLKLLLKKFEYTFRKSNPEIIERIKKHLELEDTKIVEI